MIGTMVKNSALFLPDYFNIIRSLSYPKDKLRIVFIYGHSPDNTLNLIKDFSKEGIVEVECYEEPRDKMLKLGGAQLAASIYKEWQMLLEEDYFLLLDSDLIKVPEDLLERLIALNEDIVAPYPWCEGYTHFYDSFIWRKDNRRFHPIAPYGMGHDVPIEVDSVGTCFLAKKKVFKEVEINNPYPNLSFSFNARRYGYRVIGCPHIHVLHKDVAKLGLLHYPLSPSFGGYPYPGWATALEAVIDINGKVRPSPYTYEGGNLDEAFMAFKTQYLKSLR
jgi:hypothetical protein